MQQQISVVVAGGIRLKKLIVESVRQPRYRMPVARLGGSERPLYCVPVQARLDLCILGYINVVIVIDEGMTPNRGVQRNRRNHEQESERPGVFLATKQPRMGLCRHLRCRANRSHPFSLFSQT